MTPDLAPITVCANAGTAPRTMTMGPRTDNHRRFIRHLASIQIVDPNCSCQPDISSYSTAPGGLTASKLDPGQSFTVAEEVFPTVFPTLVSMGSGSHPSNPECPDTLPKPEKEPKYGRSLRHG